MKQAKTWIWLAGVPAFVAGCAPDDALKTGKASDQPLALTAGIRVSTEGRLNYGTVVYAENPTTLLEVGDFHGYVLDGKAGGNITIKMNTSSCGAPDTVLDLFSPKDANGVRTFLAENDDAFLAPCTLDSQISKFTLPINGAYLIVATSFQQSGGGHYRLSVTCNNNACALPGAPTLAGSKISQRDIDRGGFTPAALFDLGGFLFETVYRVEDGLGNALTQAPANNQPRPNFRQFPNNVHFAEFGAPEAQSCVTCHNVGGDGGAGDRNHNIFQIGDGLNRASGLPRNPPALLGNGYRQAIAAEMTADLQAELVAAISRPGVSILLTSKGISFGSLSANADRTVNFAGVVGVDTDLIVKPFGWKGREATLRRFIESSFRAHLGMQMSTANTCIAPNITMYGSGPDCKDPDGDGVRDEITEGQLTAAAVYVGLRETPVRAPAVTPAAQTRANSGEVLFKQVGCISCHTQNMTLNSPIHVEPADTTGGAGIRLNLAVDNKAPHPASNANSSTTVELWSDFKRHDVGIALADSKKFNQIAANQFITPPLWGIADSAPYLHDGRAPTLNDAILAHAGDAQVVRNAYARLTADQQLQLQEFLLTLGRQEDKDAAPTNLSGFVLQQGSSPINFTIPAGVLVPHGGFLIVARNATKAQFEAFYGKTLGSQVTYLNSANTFPNVDGSEAFTLLDSNSVIVDGPSISEPAGGLRTLSRVNCNTAPSATASWVSVATTTASASPGTGPLNTGLKRICISEIADATNSNFEYVEIFVEGYQFQGTPSGELAAHAAMCQAQYGGSPIPSSFPKTGDCQPDGCGLNGVWLGSGVNFRTLYIPKTFRDTSTGQAAIVRPLNQANLAISRFTKAGVGDLPVDVRGQELVGIGADSNIESSSITGATLLLEHIGANNQPDIQYNLTVESVTQDDFWATGDGPTQATLYNFTATSSEGCDIALCQPGLDPNHTSGLTGQAVIFKGDLYTDDYHVTPLPADGVPALYGFSPPSANVPGASTFDVFNIACEQTDLHKLHMMRRTTAASTPASTPASGSASSPSFAERQALLRALTADYCGNGHPFTANGTPIRFDLKDPDHPLTSYSRYLPDNLNNKVSSIEAMWNENGATCLGVQRAPSTGAPTCTTPLSSCLQPQPNDDVPTFMNTLLSQAPGALIISGNPAP